ncbi:A24 family peptidase [Jatrophihabitans cynanchi]|uniref:A24 family peptidase n=1 Tax=Jatrophihabitans cynanchi TaxID=2944128 RepID=A0ABY7JWG0_9ACTN|nr:A24 family peptidase [Jatrophihabitans sp. SB3-54]WAX56903.1 A24 family peptidase [Jatrophihabitans sp. SB3-54]
MSTLVGALAGAAACVAVAPYLARLTVSVPDRDERRWWRGRPAGRGRVLLTASVAAALGALAGAAAGWSALWPALLALALVCAPLAIIDFEQHRLPNRLMAVAWLLAAALLTLAAAVRHDWAALLRALEGGAAVFAVLYLLAFASPRSFGFGDVKLGGVLGAYLGWAGWGYVYYGIFAGFLFGAVVAIGLLASRRASLKTALAFGPMLVLGALVVLAFDAVPSTLG